MGRKPGGEPSVESLQARMRETRARLGKEIDLLKRRLLGIPTPSPKGGKQTMAKSYRTKPRTLARSVSEEGCKLFPRLRFGLVGRRSDGVLSGSSKKKTSEKAKTARAAGKPPAKGKPKAGPSASSRSGASAGKKSSARKKSPRTVAGKAKKVLGEALAGAAVGAVEGAVKAVAPSQGEGRGRENAQE